MKNKGWVKLWRDQFNHWISKKPFCDGYAWCYLYSRANHKKGIVNFRNQYIEIERGQFLTSKLKLQNKFGWTYKRVSACLKALEKDKMCTIRTTNRFIIITIVNYDLYQSKEEQGVEQGVEQKPNRSRTGRHKQECIKNVKNKYKGEKKLFLDSIYLTTNEYEKLISKYGKKVIEKKIEDLQRYITRTGEKYSSHYLTIKAWIRKDEKRELEDDEPDRPDARKELKNL